jgi:hypothetical protein
MRRVNALIIPVPVACAFLIAFAYAGWHLAGRAASPPLTEQMLALTR